MVARRIQTLVLLLIAPISSECWAYGRPPQDDAKKITVAVVQSKPTTITQPYNGRIHSYRHITVRSLAKGHITAIPIKEGQAVKRGDLLFQIEPLMDKEKQDAKIMDKLFSIKAPFDGLIGRFFLQRGSVVLEGDPLTTLSDNSMMWVYFNVPEARYLEFMASSDREKEDQLIQLVLADGSKFPHPGKLGAIEAEFDERTGTIAFRADFPNPEGLLRHGQAGTVLMNRELKDAIVIPQRATFEVLDKRYVYVVDKDHVAHQREVVIQTETDDDFVVKKGVDPGDKIVVAGVKQVRDGHKVE